MALINTRKYQNLLNAIKKDKVNDQGSLLKYFKNNTSKFREAEFVLLSAVSHKKIPDNELSQKISSLIEDIDNNREKIYKKTWRMIENNKINYVHQIEKELNVFSGYGFDIWLSQSGNYLPQKLRNEFDEKYFSVNGLKDDGVNFSDSEERKFGNNGAEAKHKISNKKISIVAPYLKRIKKKYPDLYPLNHAEKLREFMFENDIPRWPKDDWAVPSIRWITWCIKKIP